MAERRVGRLRPTRAGDTRINAPVGGERKLILWPHKGTYSRPSATGQTGTSHNLGRPRGGGWVEITLSPSRDGLESVC